MTSRTMWWTTVTKPTVGGGDYFLVTVTGWAIASVVMLPGRALGVAASLMLTQRMQVGSAQMTAWGMRRKSSSNNGVCKVLLT